MTEPRDYEADYQPPFWAKVILTLALLVVVVGVLLDERRQWVQGKIRGHRG